MQLSSRVLAAVLFACAATQAEDRLQIGFESRGRYEHGGALYRHRLSLTGEPLSWLKLSGMVQDARGAVRDPADLHEGYVELFPGRKEGLSMTVGRKMLYYGEGRLLGSSQWSNLSRTFDQARVGWRSAHAHVEFLVVSPVPIRVGRFNRPELRNRVWGTYSVFTGLPGKTQLDAYVLRNLSTNIFGTRWNGPLSAAARFSLEAVLQPGKGGAWVGWVSRRWMLHNRPFELLGEYKYASADFDPLYPSNHDKFGHMDLFVWRNLHNARSLATLGLKPALAFHFMYDSWWRVSSREHLGQETDWYITYKYKHFTLGAGYGHVFGKASARYAYVFHTYSF